MYAAIHTTMHRASLSADHPPLLRGLRNRIFHEVDYIPVVTVVGVLFSVFAAFSGQSHVSRGT